MRIPQVHSVVVTGGPCSGKTTAIGRLQQACNHKLPSSTSLHVVREAATLYNTLGGRVPFGTPRARCGMTEEDRNLFWECLLNEMKRALETTAVNAALSSDAETSLVLCDRGIFDSRAYVGDSWARMLALGELDEARLRARYDCVLHLPMCSPEVYERSSANNKARREGYEEAKALDERTWQAWELTGDQTPTHMRVPMVGRRGGLSPRLVDRFGSSDGGVTMKTKARSLANAVQAHLETSPRQKRHGWSLPVETWAALADLWATADELTPHILPATRTVMRAVHRIDQRRGDAPRDEKRHAILGPDGTELQLALRQLQLPLR